MAAARPAEILRQLEAPRSTDRELLSRFVAERDQTAFAELVRRHGPVLLGVCRRITGHHQDAEDAFQAIFLILARKAKTIGNPDLLGNWLYGVSVRVAKTVRRTANRRRAREVVVRELPEPSTPSLEPSQEFIPVLDEELAALPSWYRDAIVLCDLRGIARQEAANALGVPEGTLSSRLTNGRKRLAERLTKRGVMLTAAIVSGSIPAAQAALSSELLTKTNELVADWMAGAVVPKTVARFTEGGYSMRKILALGLFTTATALAGVVFAAQEDKKPTAEPTNSTQVDNEKLASIEPLADEPKPAVAPVAIAARPRLRKAIDMNIRMRVTSLFWNSQGTRIAFGGENEADGNLFPNGSNQPKPELRIGLLEIDSMEQDSFQAPGKCALIGFSPDGKSVLTEIREPHLVSGFHKLDLWDLNKVEKAPGIEEHTRLRTIDLDTNLMKDFAFAANGKTFRTVVIDRDPGKPELTNLAVEELNAATGSTIKTLLKLTAPADAIAQNLSPDGKRLAVLENRDSLVIFDVDRGTKTSSIKLKPVEHYNIAEYEQRTNMYYTREEVSPALSFSSDGRLLVISRTIGHTSIVEAATCKPIADLEGLANIRTFQGSSPFSQDGRLLVLTAGTYSAQDSGMMLGGTSLIVWDTTTGKALKRWNVDPPIKVAFSPVRPILAVVEKNGYATRLGLWDFQAETGQKK